MGMVDYRMSNHERQMTDFNAISTGINITFLKIFNVHRLDIIRQLKSEYAGVKVELRFQ